MIRNHLGDLKRELRVHIKALNDDKMKFYNCDIVSHVKQWIRHWINNDQQGK